MRVVQVESSQSVIRILGLSATLPNYVDVADFLRYYHFSITVADLNLTEPLIESLVRLDYFTSILLSVQSL